VLHQLAPQYIDTGKVRVVYRHFAFIGPESQWAAEAAECASEQEKFWAFTNYLFARQVGENNGAFARNNLKQFAVAVGLDIQKFSACFDSGKFADVVKQQTNEGRTRGVKATPSFFINGNFIEGLPTQQQLAGYFETLLKK
jgi:protein-disulfide isomerase